MTFINNLSSCNRRGRIIFTPDFQPTHAMPSQQIPEQERLLRYLQQTDESKFMEVLFKTNYASLCRTTFRIVNDRTSLKAYLHRAAINTTLKYLEKSKRQINLDQILKILKVSVNLNYTAKREAYVPAGQGCKE